MLKNSATYIFWKNEEYLKRSRLKNGSARVCNQTGFRASDVTSVNPQSFSDTESSLSASLNISCNIFQYN